MQPPPRTALIAEDDDLSREILAELLSMLGIQVVATANGQQALERARHERFDLILLDIQMPLMSGLEAARAIRGGTPNAQTWIVAVSANAAPSERAACQAAGMDHFLAKPFRPDHLEETVLALLETARSSVQPGLRRLQRRCAPLQ